MNKSVDHSTPSAVSYGELYFEFTFLFNSVMGVILFLYAVIHFVDEPAMWLLL